jgi:hypothetical protein
MALRIGIGLAVVLVAAVLISTRDVPEGIEGRPVIAVEFPAESEPGSVQTATFTITNPGPGPMQSVFLSFARVGIDVPIVEAGSQHENPYIVGIDPEPEAVSLEGVVFRFAGLDEGETMTVSFDLKIPTERGIVANSVTAYPGEDPQRAKGIRLQTQVGG